MAKGKTKTLRVLGQNLRSEEQVPADFEFDRPRTRGDCANVPRPCPYAGCRHHLLLSVKSNGSIVFEHGTDDPLDLPADRSCSLDVADRGEKDCFTERSHVAIAMGLTLERARQLEVDAFARLMYYPAAILDMARRTQAGMRQSRRAR